MDPDALLDGLNGAQRAAVTSGASPLCILAGAGSGKTRVLTRRIAWRAATGDLDPRHVLALTFTRKAAGELRHRLQGLGLRNGVAAGTFHALALSQLSKLDSFAATRRRLAGCYDARLSELAPLLRPIGRSPWCRPVWHLYSVLIDFAEAGLTRGQLVRALAGQGIRTQVHYIPVPRQPYYRARYGEQHLPGAEAYYRRTLSLPLYVGMTEADVDRITDALTRVLIPATAGAQHRPLTARSSMS